MNDAVNALLQQATSATPLSSTMGGPMGALQLLAQLKQQPMVGGGFNGITGGGGMAPITGSGAASKLAEEAAKAAGVPLQWAHDPKFWYQTEHESGLYPTGNWQDIVKAAHADNPTSSAYGIGQFLDATRQTYNLPLHASPLDQLIAMFKYIQDRYTNPEGAYQYRMQHGFY